VESSTWSARPWQHAGRMVVDLSGSHGVIRLTASGARLVLLFSGNSSIRSSRPLFTVTGRPVKPQAPTVSQLQHLAETSPALFFAASACSCSRRRSDDGIGVEADRVAPTMDSISGRPNHAASGRSETQTRSLSSL
jgi:hypothetical protein